MARFSKGAQSTADKRQGKEFQVPTVGESFDRAQGTVQAQSGEAGIISRVDLFGMSRVVGKAAEASSKLKEQARTAAEFLKGDQNMGAAQAIKAAQGKHRMDKFLRDMDPHFEKHRHDQEVTKDWPKWRVFLYFVHQAQVYHVWSVLLVVANAWMVSVQIDDVEVFQKHPGLLVIDVCLIVHFLMELIIHFFGSTAPLLTFFNVLDVLAFIGACIHLIFFDLSKLFARGDFLPNIAIMQIFRVLRLLRCFRTIIWFMEGWRPLQMLCTASLKLHENFMGSFAFIFSFWILFAVIATSTIGKICESDGFDIEDSCRQILCNRFSLFRKSLDTAMAASTGGFLWGENLVRPLFNSRNPQVSSISILLLVSLFFSTTCLANLIVGIYLRQVVDISREYDEHTSNEDFFETEEAVYQLFDELKEFDQDRDGNIQLTELSDGLDDQPHLLQHLGLSKLHALQVFASVDIHKSGRVRITQLLFEMVKFAGFSPDAIDALSLDSSQKVFLRHVSDLQKRMMGNTATETGTEAGDASDKLQMALAEIITQAEMLREQLEEMHGTVRRDGDNIRETIRLEEALTDDAMRSANERLALAQARRVVVDRNNRANISEHLTSLQEVVVDLAAMKRLQRACAGGTAEIEGLRRLVRHQLDSQLRPWFATKLVEMGVSRSKDPFCA